jgi:hypothetical protein
MSVQHFAPRGDLPDADLRSASLIDADDVAALLCELGYPCDRAEAAQRIGAIIENDRQALVVARVGGVLDEVAVSLGFEPNEVTFPDAGAALELLEQAGFEIPHVPIEQEPDRGRRYDQHQQEKDKHDAHST